VQYVGFHENRVVRGSDDIGYYGISVAILMRLLLNCELDVLSDDGVYDSSPPVLHFRVKIPVKVQTQ